MPHPLNISNQTISAQLSIDWDDGVQQILSHLFLRSCCRCADCKALRLHSKAELTVAEDIRLTEVRLVGQYGMQLIFNDGHDRGIYPWLYLQELLSADDAIASAERLAVIGRA
ncbi:gamma-butyrobetaine hydroxylase-like domain-containing protein [Glaciimonas sp. PCH181]|uniref:DUF971 domain-containing protein n=1 Tax=Glaciimonas sp. PCH181 TaxID=2133943 RepID=UPI000D34E1CB|nr:gamma-butyrobetaine hydroxylase-like domain-containing protein [Glaciimonas sp. PCH181]PUA19002.1 hypothetical protein C7W93_03595 [Glaciimonas sp. PCH181]